MRSKVNYWVGRFLILLLAVMTLDVLWGVFTRYALGSQASWSEELARYLLIWIGVLGAAYAAGQRQHLAIDLISAKLSAARRSQNQLFIRIIVALFAFLVLVVGGLRLIYISEKLGQTSPALNIPIWAVYAVLPLSGLLILYYKWSERSHS